MSENRTELRKDPVLRLRRMVEIRMFEDRVTKLFADGAVHGTTHTCQGQEAVAVGIAAATRDTDTITCTYRGHGIALALGMSMESVMGEICGRTAGCMRGLGGSMHLCDPAVGLLPTFAIVGAGIPVAAGAALSAQVRGTDDVGVAVFGDGASNIGAFHEALNLAAIWRLPAVFVCENNVYGEYSRIDKTTPVTDIAHRAAGYGIPGEIADGQDVDAVIDAVDGAVTRARRGGGPTLLELKTYRYAGHSRSDAAAYRPAGEFDSWLERDPIEGYAARLIASGLLDSEGRAAMAEESAERIDRCVETVLESPEPTVDMMFEHVWAG